MQVTTTEVKDTKEWFRKLCGELRENQVAEEVVQALSLRGFTDPDSLAELAAMAVPERAAVLSVEATASVTDAKFGEVLRHCLFTPINLGGKSYIDIITFNLSGDGNVDEAPEILMENFNTILTFSTFLAGFEFVSVSFDEDSYESDASQAAALMLYMGFYLSSFAAVGCMLIIEFLRFSVHESTEFKVASLSIYKPVLQLMPISAFFSVILLYLSLNVNAHVVFSRGPAVASNVVSAITAAGMLYLFSNMLMRKQVYNNAARKIYMGK